MILSGQKNLTLQEATSNCSADWVLENLPQMKSLSSENKPA